MLVKKIAVPLINEKILQQAEHCYIVTSSITDAGFDFIRSRIPTKCKIDMVIGLDEATSPGVLNRVLNNYQGRIDLRIYTRNVLHGNVFIFDLPFRKSVAFVGSGSLSLSGLKDHEEIFWKVSDTKQIESLLSWFTSYYEFGEPLSESLIREYEVIYPELRKNEVQGRKIIRDAVDAAALNLEQVKFKNQYFKKEDFDALSASNAIVESPALNEVRRAIASKLETFAEDVKIELNRNGFYRVNLLTSKPSDGKVSSMFVSFSKNPSGYTPGPITLQFGITATHFALRLVVNGDSESRQMRLKFRDRMLEPEFRQVFFNGLTTLTSGYHFEVGSNQKPVDSLKHDQTLLELMQSDFEMFFPLSIEKIFTPGETAIGSTYLAGTVVKEFVSLTTLYTLMQELV